MLFAIIAAVILIADQWLKYWVTVNITLSTGSQELIPGVVKLVNIHNSGAAFGLLDNVDYARWIFLAVTAVFVVVIAVLLVKRVFDSRFAVWCEVLFLTGALGNCIDRVFLGYVVDMFKLEFVNFAVFNIADAVLVVSCLMFVIYVFFGSRGDDDEDDEDLEELSALDGDALREVLIQRLIAYKQFKGAAAALGARMQAESRMHPRVAGPDPEFLGLMPDYLAGITLRGLAVICADLDGKRQTFLLEAEHVAPHRVPLDLTVASVDRFTMAHQTCTFRELLDGDATTEQLVVTFLAMLELAKRGSLTLSQDKIFGTIQINRVEGAEAYVPGEGPELTE